MTTQHCSDGRTCEYCLAWDAAHSDVCGPTSLSLLPDPRSLPGVSCDVKQLSPGCRLCLPLPRLGSRTAWSVSSCRGGWAAGPSTGFWPTSTPSCTHWNAGPGSPERQGMRETKGRGGGNGPSGFCSQGLGSEALPPPRAPRPSPAGPPCGGWLGWAVTHRGAPCPGVLPRPSGGPALRIAGLSLASLDSAARSWALSTTVEREGGERGRQRASSRGGRDSPLRVSAYSSTTRDWASAPTARRKGPLRAAPWCWPLAATPSSSRWVASAPRPPGGLAGMPLSSSGGLSFPGSRVRDCAWSPTLVTRPPQPVPSS